MNLCPDTALRFRTLTAMPFRVLYHMWSRDAIVIVRSVRGETRFEQKWPRGHLMPHRHGDAFLIREVFLSIETVEDATAFLEACGPFRTNVHKTTMQDILGWKEFFREWLMYGYEGMPFIPVAGLEDRESERILGGLAWDISLNRKTGRVEAYVECDSALEAIGAAIAIDLLEGAEFKDCQWCKALFQVTKDNGRQYCSPACAHRGGQKRRREKAKALRAKAAKEQLKLTKGRK